MRNSLLFFIIILFLGALQAFVVEQSNSSPVVKFILPASQAVFKWNTQFIYSISVEDKEDGNSKYEEIASNEVFLKIKYLSDSSKLSNYIAQDQKDSPVMSLLKKNACFNCHGLKDKIAAPTFKDIYKKYASKSGNVDYLAGKIISGSKGVWGDAQIMPSHQELETDEAKNIVYWILQNGSDDDLDIKIGLSGLIKTGSIKQGAQKGEYVLIASYLDHGINGQNIKEGKQVLIIKNQEGK